ncbi:MAG: hypothetical protein Q4B47_03250 [Eubacteriales bacterium]|nr:hypothetical protein [Eubacteriales bacterium]
MKKKCCAAILSCIMIFGNSAGISAGIFDQNTDQNMVEAEEEDSADGKAAEGDTVDDEGTAMIGPSKGNDSSIFDTINEVEGTVYELPDGLGAYFTYMGWQCITNRASNQWAVIEKSGGFDYNFNDEGFAVVNDRYLIACTLTFGNVGDAVDFVQNDGTVITGIIGDIKNQNDPGCNIYGHNNGQVVLEFIVDKNQWYSGGSASHPNPGTSTCHPEWGGKYISKIINYGPYFTTENSQPIPQS